MCRKVINRKNIVVIHDFVDQGGTNPRFSKNIHLSFQPDTMIVKLINAIGYQDPLAKVIDTYLLYCQNINECIGSFYDGSTSTPNLTFDVKNATFNTEWIFESRNYDGELDNQSSAILAIHLEFLKHED